VVTWIAVAAYLVLFYATPFSIAVPGSEIILRRGHLLLTLFAADGIVGDWLEDASWRGLAQRAAVLSLAGAILFVATAAGWCCLRMAGIDRRWSRLETFVFAAGVGLNLVSLATLALGLAGVLQWWVFAALGVAIVAWSGVLRRCRSDDPPADRGAAFGHHPPPAPGANHGTLRLSPHWLWLMIPLASAIVLRAMLPPVDFDVREYHLQAPKEFYQNGRIEFLPHNVYANMPLGAEMLSLAAMVVCRDWWTGALVGKTLIALFAPLTAIALYAAGRRFVTPAAGVVAALVYVSIPWVALVSMQGLIEGVFAYYLIAALYTLLHWQDGGKIGAADWKLAALAGFLAGGAVSTKYPAVLFCVLPLTLWVVYAAATAASNAPARRHPPAAVAGPPLVFLAFVVLGCGLWLAKNAYFTGNPVYPLLYDALGGETRTAAKDAQWRAAHDPPNFRADDLAARAIGALLTSDWLSPLLVPLAVVGVVASRRSLAWWLAAYVGYVFVTWWLFTHRIDRFWVPILPVAALLAGMGAIWTNDRWWRAPLLVVLLFGLVSNFLTITSRALGDNRYLADYDRLRADPVRVNPWHRYLNEHAVAVTGVLLVGDAQPFDLEVPAIYNTTFDDSLLEQMARGRTPERLRQQLIERGISHVYVDWSEVARYRSPGNYGITKFIDPALFERLVAAGVLAKLPPLADNPNELYRVLDASPKRAADGSSH
jgi:hypothetical protein